MKAEKRDEWAALGRRIRKEREQRGLTQRALADAADLSDRYISNLEGGQRSPSPKALQAIAGALQIQLGELFKDVPTTYKPFDADLSRLASILKDASGEDRETVIDFARSFVRRKRRTATSRKR
jgi:transcriptional regulator with XRE-family HTH domain